MNITISPEVLAGQIDAIAAKSYAHRQLILAAFADSATDLICPSTSLDIEATVQCLKALGADITRYLWGYRIVPAMNIPEKAVLPCSESGSTFRFLLPVVGALGVCGDFILEGRLKERPLSPLWTEMERMGCHLSWQGQNTLRCDGKLLSGAYQIDGSVSSQFITGLLLGLQLLPRECTLDIVGNLQSAPYLDITHDVLKMFGLNANTIGGQRIHSPGRIAAEGDWSNAAFFLAANALGSNVAIMGLNRLSAQGDRKISVLLRTLENTMPEISAAHIPDLIPILSVVAAAKNGAVFTDIQRLRFKESDRAAAIVSMLSILGIRVECDDDTLTVHPGRLSGGTVHPSKDHRIAMAAAIAATAANAPVTIQDAECVNKSYPGFWEDFKLLGGQYELNVR